MAMDETGKEQIMAMDETGKEQIMAMDETQRALGVLWMGNRVGLQYHRQGRLSAAQTAAAENPAL